MSETEAKKPKLDVDGIQNEILDAGPSNEQPLASIFKLDVDCFEELFEWLSLGNLRFSLRQTCKRMQEIVDYYIQLNYPRGYEKFDVLNDNEHLKNFCKLDKYIKFSRGSEYSPENIKHILRNAEMIEISSERFYSSTNKLDFYKDFLRYCCNLKCLFINRFNEPSHYDDFLIGYENDWLHRKYPKLEHLMLIDFEYDLDEHWNSVSIDVYKDVRIFFKQNPNIQQISTTISFLRNLFRDDLMEESNVQFEQLTIHISFNILYYDGSGGIDINGHEETKTICDFLKKLYQKGFYKRLHVYTFDLCESKGLELITNLPALEKLHFESYVYHITTATMEVLLAQSSSLKELSVQYGFDHTKLAQNLNNVERIHLCSRYFDNFLAFIRHSPKVKEIIASSLESGIYLKNNVIDLTALNNERKALAGARKITIYVAENIYLGTKWASKEITFNLVELKRVDGLKSEQLLYEDLSGYQID